MSSTPSMMRAAAQAEYGLDAIEIVTRPLPDPGPSQVRIKVAASTFNPMDWHLATGSPRLVRLAEGVRRPKNEILGREACGIVDQLGSGVTDFEIGQIVFGWMLGAFAQYALADATRISVAPTQMNHAEIAGLPIAASTALKAVELGEVSQKRVLVNGASGGVGHYLVQIAKAHGAAWIGGTCSAQNAPFVSDLGANEVFDYKAADFTQKRWDVVIDCIGNRNDAEIKRALEPNGRWIVIGDQQKGGLVGPLPRLVTRLVRWRFGSRSCHWFVIDENARYLQTLATLTQSGQLRTHISGTLDLTDVSIGYEKIASARTVGKLALTPFVDGTSGTKN